MKTFKLKKIFILLVSGIALNIGIACNNNNASANGNTDSTLADPKAEAEKHNDAKFNGKTAADAQFVVDAANVNLKEIQLGQLAQSKATMSDVKDLGAMMVKDHQKSYDELKALAAKKSITIPTAMSGDAQKDYDALNGKTGADFDKAYCEMMVKGHKETISKFEKESKDAGDPDIQVWATNTLPVLRKHLDHSMNCLEKCKNTKSSMNDNKNGM